MVTIKNKKSPPRESSSASIGDDPIFLRMKRRLERLQTNVDIKEITRELFSLQTSRAVAALKTKSILQDALRVVIDSAVDEIACRSRATTIKLSTLQNLLMIEDIASHLSKYLFSKYGASLKSRGITTMTAQKTHIDVYLQPFIEYKRSLDYIIRMADIVLQDVDAVGWGLKRIQDALDSSKKDR